MLLSGPIAPMLATPGRALPAGGGWSLQRSGTRGVRSRTSRRAGPRISTRHGKAHHRRLPALNEAVSDLPVGTVLDGELVCLQPIESGRVRCRFDRLSGLMLAPGPHHPDADGLTVMLVAFV